MKVNIGDTVVTNEGKTGLIVDYSIKGDDVAYEVKIDNKLEFWYVGGLSAPNKKLARGDLVYVRAVVASPCEDIDGDLRIYLSNSGIGLKERLNEGGVYEWAAASEVFTIEELREIKK